MGEARVVRVEHLGPGAALLTLDVSELAERLDFKAGQFAQLKVPGSDQWRSYSFAHAPRADSQVEFLIRLLPQGAMSDYLRERALPGDRLQIRGSKGSFHLRASSRKVLLIAGGTGLSAVLAIAEQLALERSSRPVELIYGVTTEADLALTSRLAELAHAQPWLQLALHCPESNRAVAWRCRRGDRSARRRAVGRRRSGYLRVRAAADDRCRSTVAALARTRQREPLLREIRAERRPRKSAKRSARGRAARHQQPQARRQRHSGGHRRLDRRHGDGEGARQHLLPRARAGEGSGPPAQRRPSGRRAGLASASLVDRGPAPARVDLPRHHRRHGCSGRVQGRHGRAVSDHARGLLEEGRLHRRRDRVRRPPVARVVRSPAAGFRAGDRLSL